MTAALFPTLGGVAYIVVAVLLTRSRKTASGESGCRAGAPDVYEERSRTFMNAG
jgi:hypothetical protein